MAKTVFEFFRIFESLANFLEFSEIFFELGLSNSLSIVILHLENLKFRCLILSSFFCCFWNALKYRFPEVRVFITLPPGFIAPQSLKKTDVYIRQGVAATAVCQLSASQVYPVTLVFIVPTTLSTDGTTELAHQMSWQGKTFFPQSCPQQ